MPPLTRQQSAASKTASRPITITTIDHGAAIRELDEASEVSPLLVLPRAFCVVADGVSSLTVYLALSMIANLWVLYNNFRSVSSQTIVITLLTIAWLDIVTEYCRRRAVANQHLPFVVYLYWAHMVLAAVATPLLLGTLLSTCVLETYDGFTAPRAPPHPNIDTPSRPLH